jgi:hypothetical protein
MKRHCCDTMSEMLAFTCNQHSDPFDCPDCLVRYIPKFDEYSLIIHDGGSSSVSIGFCPWCGARLPDSKRDRWFDELEALGFDDPKDLEIPERYRSDAWFTEVSSHSTQPASNP